MRGRGCYFIGCYIMNAEEVGNRRFSQQRIFFTFSAGLGLCHFFRGNGTGCALLTFYPSNRTITFVFAVRVFTPYTGGCAPMFMEVRQLDCSLPRTGEFDTLRPSSC
jgi:hypothetical protein